MKCSLLIVLMFSHLVPSMLAAGRADDLAAVVRGIEPNVLVVGSEEERREVRSALARVAYDDIRERRREANLEDVRTWRAIRGREDWEKLRDERIARLRGSLGTFPEPPTDLNVRVTGTIPGEEFRIERLLFESRPRLHVTANLYVPAGTEDAAPEPRSRPGILICHSHHRPKTQGELQDMGMTWARAGCVVLVMDQVGHGERRAHPFAAAGDFDGEFAVSRQDYHFRYNTGMQLHLLGDSLIGWMVWDLMRGVDLLLARPDVDPDRIALLGAVAGGGDPAGVTAALDQRIDAVVPFNFGGPQPETVHPLPDDAELAFNYYGGGSWESTRNLRRSIGDGFPHWLIVASVAPRGLVHAHEFAWDEERDPVWRRYQRIFGEFYDRADRLASAKGRGSVRGRPPEATHCTNIGPEHRSQIHPVFREWLGIEAEEYRNRVDESDLLVLPGSGETIAPLHQVAAEVADQRIAAARESLPKDEDERRVTLRERWSELLGTIEANEEPRVKRFGNESRDGVTTQRFVVTVERSIRVPVLLLSSDATKGERPAVVCVAQAGKEAFLENRSDAIAALLEAGFDVCLPDLRATGETRVGSYRGRRSDATGLSSSELMFGETHVGNRLRDLRTVLGVLRRRPESDGRFAIWGESFAPVNEPERRIAVPLGIDEEPRIAEPLGPLLAMLTALYESGIEAVVASGGLTSFRSTLDSQFVHLPHDVIVPGAIAAGDMPLLAEVIDVPIVSTGSVDARNRAVEVKSVDVSGIVPAESPRAAARTLIERLVERR